MAKTAPGVLRMKCMIWEPNPISQRVAQDYTVVYNSTTVKSLPENIQRKLHTYDRPPYGVYLKEKYVYRDTFLKIGDEVLNSDRPDMKAENGEALFDGNGKANFPYIDHQMFVLNGSLYSPNVVTPTGIKQATAESLDNGLSKWTYQEMQVPFDHDGHDGSNNDSSNDHDFVSVGGVNRQTNDENFEATLRKSNASTEVKNAILARKVRRFMPAQVASSSEQKKIATSTGISGQTKDTAAKDEHSKPIHWLCKKLTALYSGEDFFVEFVRLAYQHDIVPDSADMRDEFIPIDARYSNASDGIIRNGAVVELASNGQVAKETIDTYNLSNQPYYIIELGNGTLHNYFIILAYNGYPILAHVGRFPIKMPANEDKPPVVIFPEVNCSRRLGIYRDVSCKQLIDQESLRVTVRNHLGKIIVTFSGHEGNPWVISRTDFAPTSEEMADAGLVNIEESPVPMEIAPAPIQVGGGNLKCGFLFGPLHYETSVEFDLPNAITVKGPVTDEDISMLLGERGQVDRRLYFQDAELYYETFGGVPNMRPKTDTDTKWPVKGDNKDTNASGDDLRNGDGERVSYIAIAKTTPLASTPDPEPPEDAEEGEEIPGAGTFIKWFSGKFGIRSGDATVGGQMAAGKEVPRWRLNNCITPIATGWRLYVPPNDEGHGQLPVDVAHHVETFSHSWSYSDNAKVEHTGSIRFRINLGTPLSMQYSGEPIPNDATVPAPDGRTDQAAFLTSLADKTFFVRIYAWWEGGYMDCANSTCPCRRPGGPNAGATANERRVVFTGLAHGGEITIEGYSRYMDCQLLDYMKIMQDQYFLNSPFFDGMNDYFAAGLISHMAGFTDVAQGSDLYAPAFLINQAAAASVNPNNSEWNMQYSLTGEVLFFMLYTLPSSYDILQNPFMKFADSSKFDEALTKIGTLAGKVAYFDRFGVFRYDVRPDARFLSPIGQLSRRPKCNFMASPYATGTDCANLDLLALNQYSYKRVASDVVNDILLVTDTPQGEVLVKSVLNIPGRYDPTTPGYIGYTKRMLVMDGIFGSQQALESVAKYYASIVFRPPIVVSWESMGMSHLQAMDIVTFTGLNDDLGFPPDNVELGGGSNPPPIPSLTLVLTSVNGEINARSGEWRNRYEGEWLYGNVP